MPFLVLFAKITPKRVEATAFAMLTGTANLVGTMRSWVGTGINAAFVGVSEKNLDNYYILVIISTVMAVTPLFYLRLLPSRSAIELKEA